MTPKEKAKELCLKFKEHAHGTDINENGDFYTNNDLWIESAKKCALIFVNEMIKEKESYGQGAVYWHNVKREIEIFYHQKR
jgi:hypothetical protein